MLQGHFTATALSLHRKQISPRFLNPTQLISTIVWLSAFICTRHHEHARQEQVRLLALYMLAYRKEEGRQGNQESHMCTHHTWTGSPWWTLV